MVGAADAINLIKICWETYWSIHLYSAITKWLDGNLYITIPDALDEEIKLSEKYWSEWTGTPPYDYKGSWTLFSLVKNSFKIAKDEVYEYYNSLDGWTKPENAYIFLPMADPSKEGPRFDLMNLDTVLIPMFTAVRLLIESLLSSEIATTIRTAILNINPEVVGTEYLTFKDDLDGVYKLGSECTPVRKLQLADIATVWGLIKIFRALLPYLKMAGRMGAIAIKHLFNMLFRATKSAASWLKHKVSREMMASKIANGVTGDLEDYLEETEEDIKNFVGSLVGVRLTLS